MLRKEITAFFQAIRKKDNEAVVALLDGQPSLIGACAKAPPKKDDGQSPLQVAFKTGNLAAARLLLDRGADPKFQETSEVNEWTAPVLHDALRACAFGPPEDRPESLELLARVLQGGADPNDADSYGNTPLHRVLMDARQCWNLPDSAGPDRLEHLRRVFDLLRAAGADVDRSSDERPSPRSMVENEPVLLSLLAQP